MCIQKSKLIEPYQIANLSVPETEHFFKCDWKQHKQSKQFEPNTEPYYAMRASSRAHAKAGGLNPHQLTRIFGPRILNLPEIINHSQGMWRGVQSTKHRAHCGPVHVSARSEPAFCESTPRGGPSFNLPSGARTHPQPNSKWAKFTLDFLQRNRYNIIVESDKVF